MNTLWSLGHSWRRLAWETVPLAVTTLAASVAFAQSDEPSPFTLVPATLVSNGTTYLSLSFRVPAHHHIYADRISFEANGTPATLALPAPTPLVGRFNHNKRLAYETDFRATVLLPASRGASWSFEVGFQGCSDSECYFPESHRWVIHADNSLASLDDPAPSPATATSDATFTNGFHITSRASGFLGTEKFLGFLTDSPGTTPGSGDLSSTLARLGLVATLSLILVGGLALNLTPCVLPMIPINLAILGAGSQNGNRRRGFLLGSVYGAGMAAAYGVLGLAVVLTGSKFGTLNASPWFNFSIAALFVVLGLAMFDRLSIDFSRFQSVGGKSKGPGGAILAAGFMGAVSALLAGACVAPVVISVLLLATTLYQHGDWMALALPFVLGLGMALPWPFAAAGLSFLPRPGAWMSRVKYAFGMVIFAFALWYGWLGWNLSGFGGAGPMLVAARSNGIQDLQAALAQARATGRPVLVDFWASWCKNCEAMEHSTFRDRRVRETLNRDFLFVRFEAERLNDAALRPVLDQFGVLGLPTYVVLRPDASAPASAASSEASIR